MKPASGFVLDAAVALHWLYQDGDPTYMRGVFDRISPDTDIHVPPLWLAEIMNGAVMAMRHKNYDRQTVNAFLDTMRALPIRFYQPVDWKTGLALALDDIEAAFDYGLTAYDYTYLSTALRLALPLATLDQALSRAARQAGIADVVS